MLEILFEAKLWSMEELGTKLGLQGLNTFEVNRL